ncbi:MAG: hypothetical protein DHS20C18_00270 [Saprospiraceae bacterium]|nr:MAG: hypothetical protein DHS20C18_00270 [Saprospiraceae bacterium]
MKIIIIDTIGSQAINGQISQPKYNYQNYWVPKNNNKTAFELAGEVNAMCNGEESLLLLLNIHIRHANSQDFYYGIELLKEIRINEYYDQLSYIQKVHIVLFSTFSVENLLKKQEPKFFIILSPGTTFIKLPTEIDQDKFEKTAKQQLQNIEVLKPYFKVSDTIVEERHGHANWWAATRFLHHYFAFYPYDRHDPIMHKFLTFRTPQARDAQFIYAEFLTGALQEKKLTRFRKKIDFGRSHLQAISPGGATVNRKIGMIDDQALQIMKGVDLGWMHLHSLLFFGKMEGVHVLDYQQSADVVLDQIDDSFDCLLLDLMLGEEDRHLKIEKTRGAQLLYLIKKRYPMLPVVITTASNKAETRRALRKLGCDAFWIKEAIEKKLNTQESMIKVINLLDSVAKLTGPKFKLLKICKQLLDQLANEENWWNNYIWSATHNAPAHITNVNQKELFIQLDQGLLLIRTFLQNQLIGEGYNTALEESFWLSGVIVRFARMIENIHGKSASFDNNVSIAIMRSRGDLMGAKLYLMRHKAAHYNEKDPVDFEFLASFMKAFFCYLKLGPSEDLRKGSSEDAPIVEMIKMSGVYQQLYESFD